MPTDVLRPNADVTNNWTKVGGPSAGWECLDDALEQPTNAATSGDGDHITGTTTNGTTQECHVGTFTLGSELVTKVTLWVYCLTGSKKGVEISLRSGAAQLGVLTVPQNEAAGWRSIAVEGARTQGEIDDLRARFVTIQSAGGGGAAAPTVYAAYIEVAHEVPEPEGEPEGAYAEAVLEDEPRGYWRVGESSGTKAEDTSGNSHPGTYEGTPTLGVTGAVPENTAITLNTAAEKELVSVPDHADFDVGDVFTIEAWVKRSATLGTLQTIASKDEGSFIFRFNAENKAMLRRYGVADVVTATLAVTDELWHHIVLTKNGATVKIYIDAEDVTGTVTNSTLVNTAVRLTWGTENGGEDPLKGSLDELAIYGTALSAERVKAHFDAASESSSEPVEVPLGSSPATSDATLALRAPTKITYGPSDAVATPALSVHAPTKITLGSSDAVSETALTQHTPITLPLGASAASSETTLSIEVQIVLSLVPAVAASDTDLTIKVPVVVPVGASAATAETSLALTVAEKLSLAAAEAVAEALLSTHSPTALALGTSTAVSDATLDVGVQINVPLEPAAAVSETGLAARAKTEAPLVAAAAQADTELTFTAPVGLLVSAAEAQSETSLAARAPTALPLDAASGQADTSLAAVVSVELPLAPIEAQSETSLDLKIEGEEGPQEIDLATTAVSETALAVTARTTLPLEDATGTTSATLALRAEPLPIAPSEGQSDTQAAVQAKTVVPLDASTAQADTSLAVAVPADVPLDPVTGQSDATLAVGVELGLDLGAAASTSETVLGITAATALPLAISAGLADNDLTLILPAELLLAITEGQADAELTLVTPVEVLLAEALGVSVAELSAHAATAVPLQESTAEAEALLKLLYGGIPAMLVTVDRAVANLALGAKAQAEVTLTDRVLHPPPTDKAETEVATGDRALTIVIGDRG
jgi:hypothetical protein